MLKKFFALLSVFFIAVALVGCGNEGAIDDKAVLKFLKDYKTEQYTIENPSNPPTEIEIAEKVKGFLSEEVLKKQEANRVFGLATNYAKKTNTKIELEDVTIEKDKQNKDGTVDYNYTATLKLNNGKTTEKIKKKGQLTISNDGNLKITRDWEEIVRIGNEGI